MPRDIDVERLEIPGFFLLRLIGGRCHVASRPRPHTGLICRGPTTRKTDCRARLPSPWDGGIRTELGQMGCGAPRGRVVRDHMQWALGRVELRLERTWPSVSLASFHCRKNQAPSEQASGGVASSGLVNY